MRRIIGLALIIALTALSSVAEQLRDQLWQSYQGYTSPYLAALPRGATRLPMSPRVVVVLVRALRLAESKQMPTLNDLRQHGADVTIALTPPAYQLPTTFGLLSGATPDTHGVTSNGNLRQLPDTIFGALQTITRSVAIVGESTWADWFESNANTNTLRIEQPDEPDSAARDGQAIELA